MTPPYSPESDGVAKRKNRTPKEMINAMLVSSRVPLKLWGEAILDLHQMDMKITFLNGDIDETIYMVQPENFVSGDPNNMVCKLNQSIFGLKQASRQLYFKFHQVIISFDFEMNLVDDCIYHRLCWGKYIFLVPYVDEI